MSKVQVWVKRRKTKKGYSYAVQWVDQRSGRVKTESCGRDKALARHKAAERRRELLNGTYSEIVPVSFDDFKTEHLEQISGVLSEGSKIEHELALGQFKAACNPNNLTSINSPMLEKFRNARIDAGVSKATVNKGLRSLRSALEYAVKRGYLKANPFKGHTKALFLKEPEKEPVFMEPHEFKKLLAACPSDFWRGICLIAYHGGLRKNEILNIRWQDIDLENEIITVCNTDEHLTKSRKNRKIPMTQSVKAVLEKLRKSIFVSDYVFNNKENRPIINNFYRDFSIVVVKAGLVDKEKKARFSIHDLRRSCATELLRAGVPPKTAQRILGHANLETTMKYYVGVKDEDMTAAVKKMETNIA